MSFTSCVKTRYEIEIDEKGQVTNCFREDKTCFFQDEHQIASNQHRSPIDMKTILKTLQSSSVVSVSTDVLI